MTPVGSSGVGHVPERIASKTEYTFPDHVAAALRTSAGASSTGVVVRANEEELHLVLSSAAPALVSGAEIELALDLEDGSGDLHVRARVDRIEASEGSRVLQLALVDLAQLARDRLFDRLVERAIPAMIDPLTLAWRDAKGREPAAPLARYYLPLETTVL